MTTRGKTARKNTTFFLGGAREFEQREEETYICKRIMQFCASPNAWKTEDFFKITFKHDDQQKRTNKREEKDDDDEEVGLPEKESLDARTRHS